jgi:hypothetical protein
MSKKHLLMLLLSVLSIILAACSPSEPPIGSPSESPLESSTPLETSDYNYDKICINSYGRVEIGVIDSVESFSKELQKLIDEYEERVGDRDTEDKIVMDVYGNEDLLSRSYIKYEEINVKILLEQTLFPEVTKVEIYIVYMPRPAPG